VPRSLPHQLHVDSSELRSIGTPGVAQLETSVLMAIVAVFASGILIGLRFKAPALIALTALLLIGSFAWNDLGLPGYVTVAKFIILAFALACAYVIGLALAVHWKRNEG